MARWDGTSVHLARCSSNETVLRAALRAGAGDLDVAVASNPNLPESLWWELYKQPRVPVDLAVTLCRRRDLTVEQLEFVYRKERRRAPRESALRSNGVPPPLTGLVSEAPWCNASMAAAWLHSGQVDPQVLLEVARRSGAPQLAVKLFADGPLPDDLAAQLVMLAASDATCSLLLGLLQLLDDRPGAVVELVRQLAVAELRPGHRWALVAAAESRWFSPELLAAVEPLLHHLAREAHASTSREPWQAAAVSLAVAAIWGNPNTPVDRLEPVAALLAGLPGPPEQTAQTALTRVRELRSRCTVAVAGPWGKPLPPAQARTLSVLARNGLLFRLQQHPRCDAVDGRSRDWDRPDLYDDLSQDSGWRFEPPDPSHVPSASSSTSTAWVGERAGGARFLDQVLADAPQGVWDAVFALLPSWSASVQDLVMTVRALSR